MSVVHLPPTVEVEILPSPVLFRVKATNRFLRQLEGGEPVGYSEYATVSVDEATGTVNCQSGFGDFSYSWPASGRGADIFTFLASLGFDYFMGKAAVRPWQELDLARTIEFHRNEIRHERRGRRGFCDLSKELANEMWDALDSIEGEHPRDETHLFFLWQTHSCLSEWFVDYSPTVYHRVSPTAQSFWDLLWRPLVTSEQFRAHMKPRRAVA
jgi:hypothetical protein